MCATSNGQMKRHCVLTALCIVEDKVMDSTGSVSLSIPVPGKGLTGYYCCISMCATSNGQMKSYCVLTPLCIVEDKVMDSTGSVSLSIPVPGKGLTGYYRSISMCATS